MTKQDHRISVDSGKYTFVSEGFGAIDILRYGQPWHSQTQAGNALHSMMCELDAARVVVQAARKAAEALERLPLLVAQQLAKQDTGNGLVRLVRAIDQHDRLVSDREPPSAWCGAERSAEAKTTAASGRRYINVPGGPYDEIFEQGVAALNADGGDDAPPAPCVVVQLVNPKLDTHSGLRLVVDGEVIDTGDFGGEPEDNCECRDYKWVKGMLVGLAKRLGADARIEIVEIDGDGPQIRENYYAAMAAPYRKPEGK